MKFKGDEATAHILMGADRLLVWDGWKRETKKFILANDPIRLVDLLPPYRNALLAVYQWLAEAIQDAHVDEVDAANDLIRRRNLALTDGQFDNQEAFMAMVQRSVADWRASGGSEGQPPASGR